MMVPVTIGGHPVLAISGAERLEKSRELSVGQRIDAGRLGPAAAAEPRAECAGALRRFEWRAQRNAQAAVTVLDQYRVCALALRLSQVVPQWPNYALGPFFSGQLPRGYGLRIEQGFGSFGAGDISAVALPQLTGERLVRELQRVGERRQLAIERVGCNTQVDDAQAVAVVI